MQILQQRAALDAVLPLYGVIARKHAIIAVNGAVFRLFLRHSKYASNNSYKEMVTFFAAEEKLSEKDLEDILTMIKNKK